MYKKILVAGILLTAISSYAAQEKYETKSLGLNLFVSAPTQMIVTTYYEANRGTHHNGCRYELNKKFVGGAKVVNITQAGSYSLNFTAPESPKRCSFGLVGVEVKIYDPKQVLDGRSSYADKLSTIYLEAGLKGNQNPVAPNNRVDVTCGNVQKFYRCTTAQYPLNMKTLDTSYILTYQFPNQTNQVITLKVNLQ